MFTSLTMYISVAEAFITLVRQVVDQMNKVFPEAGMGSTKLAVAVQMVEKGLTTIENAENFLTMLLPMITPTITVIAEGLKTVKAGSGNPPTQNAQVAAGSVNPPA